jgi:hypothetical protein
MPDYTPEEANGECGGCEYHLTEMDWTQTQNIGDIIKSDQTCGRILKRKSDGNLTTEGCEECDNKSESECTEHCEWKGNINKCVLGTIGGDCSLIGCHQKCQYPFRNQDAYTTEGNSLLQSEPGFGEPMITINDKLDQVSRLSVPTIYSKTDKYYNNVREIFNERSISSGDSTSTNFTQGVYGGVNIADEENCGPLKEAATTNHHIKFPDPPDFEDFLEIVKNHNNLQGEINWFAINPISYEQLSDSPLDSITGGNYLTVPNGTDIIPLSNNGISLQWWKDGVTGDLVPLDDPQLIQIGDTASIITKTFGTIQNNPLYNYLQSNPIPNYDFSRICQQQLRDADISSVLAPTGEDNFIFSFLLNVGPDAEQNRSFERCMNRLMRTPGDNDKRMVSSIKTLTSISDLGDNPELLDYVERKIKKFLSLRTDQFDKCIEKIEISDNICSDGLFPNAMDMLSRILDMETGRVGNSDTDLEESKIKVASDRLLKYVPQLLKKILEISDNYENDYCGSVSPKTQLLQEIYDNLFKKEISLNIPDLGLGGFFEEFDNYGIIGKVVLMLFFVYILTQVVALFKVNVAV